MARTTHLGEDTMAKSPNRLSATDAVLRGIMVDNPRRFLAFVPKRPRKAI